MGKFVARRLAESNRQFRRREAKEESEQQVQLLRAVVWEGVVHGSFFADTDRDHELIINLCCELMTLIINYNVMNN